MSKNFPADFPKKEQMKKPEQKNSCEGFCRQIEYHATHDIFFDRACGKKTEQTPEP